MQKLKYSGRVRLLVQAVMGFLTVTIALAYPHFGSSNGWFRIWNSGAFNYHSATVGRAAPMFNTITVTTTADTIAADGQCSLREAITAANTNTAVNECPAGAVGSDTITFNIPGAGIQTITLTSALPTLTEPVIINGATQPGFVATPLIEINANGNSGLVIQGGNSTIRSLILNRISGDAITIQNNGTNVIAGNYIGLNSAGTAASANTGNGISIPNAANNIIGGTNATDRNVISGNGNNGILIQNSASSNNQILGNFIGVNAAGTAAVPNGPAVNPANTAGINVNSAPNNTIGGTAAGSRNVISGNTGEGILFVNSGAAGNTVAGNFIGTDVTGAVAIGNGVHGIVISSGAQTNTIGGTSAAARNVISGNVQNGVALLTVVVLDRATPVNTIQGNYIGTNAAGTATLANGLNGISDNGVPGTVIGGTTAGAGNVISGNGSNGILITSSGANGETLQGNFIGTDFTGTAALANGGAGVFITASAGNLIGGTTAGAGNIIAFNTGAGVAITDNSSTNDAIETNSIFSNGGLGIDLNNDGVTPNDLNDPDIGPNNLQNFPVITSGTPVITGTLNSTASTTYRLEFFSSPTADPSGFGEGKTFLGIATVTTSASNNATFFFSSPQIAAGQFITATATDPTGNTSEFSQAFQATAPTAVNLGDVKALRNQGNVSLQWSGTEARNLGFNVYRDNPRDRNGRKTLLTPQPMAGSALITSATAADGRPRTWIDENAPAGARYWIEDIDLDGKRTMHGPFTPVNSGTIAVKRSRLVTELNPSETDRVVIQHGFPVAAGDAIAAGMNSTSDRRTDAEISKRQIASRVVVPAPTSSLESQSAVKIYVNQDAWYRVTAAQLTAAGFASHPGSARLQLFTGGVQVPMQIDADGSIEFYGQGLDTPTTDQRPYWLVVGRPMDLAVAQSGNAGSSLQSDFAYTNEQRYRTTYFSSLLNGDAENIFGPIISGTVVSETLNIQNLSGSGPATLDVALQGATSGQHIVDMTFNGVDLGPVNFSGTDHPIATLNIPAGVAMEGENTVTLSRTGGGEDVSLLDFLRITYQRQYRAVNNSLTFSVDANQSAVVTGFTNNSVRLLDISNPQSVQQIAVTLQADQSGFAMTVPVATGARTMLALTDDAANSPVRVAANNPSNWRSRSHAADLLVISYGDFRSAVEPLVDARRAQGLRVEVADVEDVYDEFSFGVHTPQALKDFLSWAKTHWGVPPRYVLLVGDSTWDPRNYLGRGDDDFVPTKLIDTSQLETASDDWIADFNNDGMPEMAVGRLPVRTADQASAVVSKILSFGASGPNPNGALLVSDTGFEAGIADTRGFLPSGMTTQVIDRGDGSTDATVRAEILASLSKGPLLVDYMGHGSIDEWTGARLLTSDDAATLTNGNRLSVLILMTCLNGYSHDVFVTGLGKAMLLQPNVGAVAAWSSSGITTPDSQQQMTRLFYSALFGGTNPRLGDAILKAKASTLNPDVRRTWELLGDPTMTLSAPQH